MVSFNLNDFNIEKIRLESKLFNLTTVESYRIYGLKQSEGCLVEIGYDRYNYTNTLWENIDKTTKFLIKNNINCYIYTIDGEKYIKIGLRRDLRKHVILTSAILKTLVYGIEGRINFNDEFIIPSLPKFK